MYIVSYHSCTADCMYTYLFSSFGLNGFICNRFGSRTICPSTAYPFFFLCVSFSDRLLLQYLHNIFNIIYVLYSAIYIALRGRAYHHTALSTISTW